MFGLSGFSNIIRWTSLERVLKHATAATYDVAQAHKRLNSDVNIVINQKYTSVSIKCNVNMKNSQTFRQSICKTVAVFNAAYNVFYYLKFFKYK